MVFQDFLSREEADAVAAKVRVELSRDQDDNLLPMQRHHEEAQMPIYQKLVPLVPKIESHYTGFKYRGTEDLLFQQFPPTGKPAEDPHCENAVYKRKKWIRVKDRDLTGILWLKDYQQSPPFDLRSQVLGGKLEFPVYNFGFQPQKGTLVIYPACQRFISLTSPILVGELQCVRFHICGDGPNSTIWLYQPEDYPGDFRTWFSEIV